MQEYERHFLSGEFVAGREYEARLSKVCLLFCSMQGCTGLILQNVMTTSRLQATLVYVLTSACTQTMLPLIRPQDLQEVAQQFALHCSCIVQASCHRR